MSTAESRLKAPSIIELHCEDREGRVKVVLPDSHIMVMPVEAAVQACGAFKNQIEFRDQFQLLIDRLVEWTRERASVINGFYLTVRDAGLLFLVLKRDRTYDPEFQEELTDLDLEIANDADFNLIRLDVLALPRVAQESVKSFLAVGRTFWYGIDG